MDTTVGPKQYYCTLYKPLNRGHSFNKGQNPWSQSVHYKGSWLYNIIKFDWIYEAVCWNLTYQPATVDLKNHRVCDCYLLWKHNIIVVNKTRLITSQRASSFSLWRQLQTETKLIVAVRRARRVQGLITAESILLAVHGITVLIEINSQHVWSL